VLHAWVWLDEVEKLCAARKEVLRHYLLDTVGEKGEASDKGSFRLEVDGTVVVKERRGGQKLDGERLMDLLTAHKLEVSQGFDEVRLWQLNPSKVQWLLETGVLSEAEVEGLYNSPSYALRVKKSAELETALAKVHGSSWLDKE
jgi:hypothetical protein